MSCSHDTCDGAGLVRSSTTYFSTKKAITTQTGTIIICRKYIQFPTRQHATARDVHTTGAPTYTYHRPTYLNAHIYGGNEL